MAVCHRRTQWTLTQQAWILVFCILVSSLEFPADNKNKPMCRVISMIKQHPRFQRRKKKTLVFPIPTLLSHLPSTHAISPPKVLKAWLDYLQFHLPSLKDTRVPGVLLPVTSSQDCDWSLLDVLQSGPTSVPCWVPLVCQHRGGQLEQAVCVSKALCRCQGPQASCTVGGEHNQFRSVSINGSRLLKPLRSHRAESTRCLKRGTPVKNGLFVLRAL